MGSVIITSNISLDSASTIRIETKSPNTYSFIAAGANALHVSSGTVAFPISPNIGTIPFNVTGNIKTSGTVAISGNFNVFGNANVTGAMAIGGNLVISGSIESANLVVAGSKYHKAGAWERIAVNTAVSAANVKFNNIPTVYKALRISINNLVPDTTNTYPIMKFSTDGGITNNSSGYIGYNWRHASNRTGGYLGAPSGNVRTWSTSSIDLNGAENETSIYQSNTATIPGFSGEISLYSYGQAQKTKLHGWYLFCGGSFGIGAALNLQCQLVSGWWNHQVVNDGLDIYYSSGSTFSGTIYLDGLRA